MHVSAIECVQILCGSTSKTSTLHHPREASRVDVENLVPVPVLNVPYLAQLALQHVVLLWRAQLGTATGAIESAQPIPTCLKILIKFHDTVQITYDFTPLFMFYIHQSKNMQAFGGVVVNAF